MQIIIRASRNACVRLDNDQIRKICPQKKFLDSVKTQKIDDHEAVAITQFVVTSFENLRIQHTRFSSVDENRVQKCISIQATLSRWE